MVPPTTTPNAMLTKSDIGGSLYGGWISLATAWAACLWAMLGPVGLEWSWGVVGAAGIAGAVAAPAVAIPLGLVWRIGAWIIGEAQAARGPARPTRRG